MQCNKMTKKEAKIKMAETCGFDWAENNNKVKICFMLDMGEGERMFSCVWEPENDYIQASEVLFRYPWLEIRLSLLCDKVTLYDCNSKKEYSSKGTLSRATFNAIKKYLEAQ